MSDEYYEIHADFLKGLFSLYLSLTEALTDDSLQRSSKLIFAKYLEVFHDEVLADMNVSDAVVYLDNPSDFKHVVQHFFLDNAEQYNDLELEFSEGNFFVEKPYFTIKEVKLQIDKLVKSLHSRLTFLGRKSRPPSKSKKLPFE
jgi:hypothetical protein